MLTEDTDDRFTDRNMFRVCFEVNVRIKDSFSKKVMISLLLDI